MYLMNFCHFRKKVFILNVWKGSEYAFEGLLETFLAFAVECALVWKILGLIFFFYIRPGEEENKADAFDISPNIKVSSTFLKVSSDPSINFGPFSALLINTP